MIGGDPTIQSTLQSTGLLEYVVQSFQSDNINHDSIIQCIGNLINTLYLHSIGQNIMSNINHSPLELLISLVFRSDVVLFDRFGDVANQIGENIQDLYTRHIPINNIIKIIIYNLNKLYIEEKYNKHWRPLDPVLCNESSIALTLNYINTREITIDHIRNYEQFYKNILSDKMANIGRFLPTVLKNIDGLHQFLSMGGFRKLFDLCILESLPPFFLILFSQHPLVNALKHIGSYGGYKPSLEIFLIRNIEESSYNLINNFNKFDSNLYKDELNKLITYQINSIENIKIVPNPTEIYYSDTLIKNDIPELLIPNIRYIIQDLSKLVLSLYIYKSNIIDGKIISFSSRVPTLTQIQQNSFKKINNIALKVFDIYIMILEYLYGLSVKQSSNLHFLLLSKLLPHDSPVSYLIFDNLGSKSIKCYNIILNTE